MAIHIQQPVFLHEKGRRPNNEDSIYPLDGSATNKNRLFIVCDGVGGANKGEIASRMTADLFHDYFKNNPAAKVNNEFVNNGLRFVEQQLTEHAANSPECAGMATTLTLLYLNNNTNSAVVGWCGDSRVYHIRNGKILYVTEDHSLVNELVKRGELTEEEAQMHPQRNVILRAISGSDQPSKIDVHEITDIQADDFLLLATDGILESIDDRVLLTLLNDTEADIEQVQGKIKQMCDMLSKDNFSMYLLKVENIANETPVINTKVFSAEVENSINKITATKEPEPPEPKIPEESVSKKGNKQNMKFVYLAAIAALSVLIAMSLYKLNDMQQKERLVSLKNKAEIALAKENIDEAIDLYKQGLIDFPNETFFKTKSDSLLLVKTNLAEKEAAAKALTAKLTLLADSIWNNAPKNVLKRWNVDSLSLYGFVEMADSSALNKIKKQLLIKPKPKPKPKPIEDEDNWQILDDNN